MIYNQTRYKSFLIDESAFQGVCWVTVHRWRKAGRFGNLSFVYRNKKSLFVTGTTSKLPKRKNGRPFKK